MALLDWFPEIHLCLSIHYCLSGAFPSAGSGWEPAHTVEYRTNFTPFVSIYQFGVNNACFLHRL